MGGPGSGRRPKIDDGHQAMKPVPTTTVQTGKGKTRAPAKIEVTQPTGGKIAVLTAGEKLFYDGQHQKYTKDFRFTSSTDLADLDRLLFQELLDFRWTVDLARGKDRDGRDLLPSMEDQLRRNKNDAAKAISILKNDLGMTRVQRDAETDSFAAWFQRVGQRAKEFGVHRNNQVIEALKLFNELKSHVQAFDRSNELERQKLGFEEPGDILEWIRSVAIPRYDKVDDEWRKTKQKYWEGM